MGEIGKNMTAFEYGNDMIVVDCGISFPDDDMPGIDVVIPDMAYLRENRTKFKGFMITHGHEDHIGALPYALKDFDVPVYGTAFTIALIEHKLEEARVTNKKLTVVKPGDTVELGCFKVEFIKTGHSIAGAVALAINTPIGTVIHTGDFKVDFTPIDGEPIDIIRFAHYGARGVLALMSDSTNIESPGHTQSGKKRSARRLKLFRRGGGAHHRGILCQQRLPHSAGGGCRHQPRARGLLSGQEHGAGGADCHAARLPQDSAGKHREGGSAQALSRRSGLRDHNGSQGEPMSGLFRMATATHRLNIGKGDTVIISASAIPGNEVGVSRVINQLYQKGAEVIYNRMADVHVSGHACREKFDS